MDNSLSREPPATEATIALTEDPPSDHVPETADEPAGESTELDSQQMPVNRPSEAVARPAMLSIDSPQDPPQNGAASSVRKTRSRNQQKSPEKTKKKGKGRGKQKKRKAKQEESAENDQTRNSLTYTVPARGKDHTKFCILCGVKPEVKNKKKKDQEGNQKNQEDTQKDNEIEDTLVAKDKNLEDVPVAKNSDVDDTSVTKDAEVEGTSVAKDPEVGDDSVAKDEYIKCAYKGCTQKMHKACAEVFICSEYSPKQAQELFEGAKGPVCPAHFCWHCYEERVKHSARFGDPLVNCEKCFRSFHVRCIPAGTKIMEIPGKRNTIECHEHVVNEPKITPAMRIKHCLECDKGFDDANLDSADDDFTKMECKKCTNVFHKKCCYKEVKGLNSEEYDHDICARCLIGSVIVANQKVLAFYPHRMEDHSSGNFPATAVALSDVPIEYRRKLGTLYGKVGYIPVQWEWTDRGGFFNMIPKSRVQFMTQKSERSVADASFRPDAIRAKEYFKAPVHPLDHEAMLKTIEIVERNIYPKGALTRLEELKLLEACECNCKEDENGVKCNMNDCWNRNSAQECPKSCDEKEGIFCANRAMQRKAEKPPKYEVKLADNNKGFGVFAIQTIEHLEYIFEYAGEVIDKKEHEKRLKRVAELRAHDECPYTMGLKGNYLVDARFKGSDARFVNHSCDPNCEVFSADIPKSYPSSTHGKYEPRLKVQSIRRIEVGEEITFNYGLVKARGLALAKCRCGSPKCVGTFGAKTEKEDDDDETDESEDDSEEEESDDEKENEQKSKKGASATKKKTNKRRRSTAFSGPSTSKMTTPKRKK